MENYFSAFHKKNDKKKYGSSESNFFQENQGFMKFRVSEYVSTEFKTITINEKKYSIVDGVYISPYAKSILEENRDIIDGMMLDTTWKLIQNYVVSILVASSCNVSVPLGFSFGKAETKEEYQLLFSFFFIQAQHRFIKLCI